MACCKGYESIHTVGVLVRAVIRPGYAAHAQGRGAVASMSAGTLELDGSTIVNTASTTVRTVGRGRGVSPLRSQWRRGAVAEKCVRIGAGRQRMAEIRAALAVARGAALSGRSCCCSAGRRAGAYRRHAQACKFSSRCQGVQRVRAFFAHASLSTRSIGRAGSFARRRLFRVLQGRAEQCDAHLSRKPGRNRSAGREGCFGCAQLYAARHGTRGGGGCDGLLHYQSLRKLHDQLVGASEQDGYRQLTV